MAQPTAADIAKLCDDWCTASATPDGGMAIGANTERFRLLANGVVFHELDHEMLCTAIVSTSKVLLRHGLNTIIDHDHVALWSWCSELLLSPRAQIFPNEQREIKSLYETAIHASLAGCRKPVGSKEEWQEQNRIEELQPHHSKLLIRKSGILLTYLAFPLLEAVLKRACARFVAFDGKVVAAFTIAHSHGASRQYDPQGRCSSLRDMLLLHHDHVADADLKTLVDQFRDHISALDRTQDPFDLIYSWRNQSLHGTASFQTIGGTILNFALLVSLSELKQNFDQHRATILDHCRREAQSPHKSPWSFYPPY